jgi:hypothetical protein
MSGAFELLSIGARISDSVSPGTRFFIGDSASPTSQLFISRTRYSDILYRCTEPQKHQNFVQIYETERCERIICASCAPSQPWYLVGLLRFGDGIDPRVSSRAIFLDYAPTGSSEYPVSTRTYDLQFVTWACEPDSYRFRFSTFDGTIRVFELTYQKDPMTFKIALKHQFQSQIFRTGYIASPEERVVRCASSSRTQFPFPDLLQTESCPLPSTIDWMMNSEVRIFSTPGRRSLMPPIPDQRVIIHTNPYVLMVVVPFSHLVMPIRLDYLDIDLPDDVRKKNAPEQSDSSALLPFLNYPLSEAPYQPVSRLPFAFYCNEFVLVAAPRGSVTAFLIDQADRVRATFRAEVPDGRLAIHRTVSLTRSASRVLGIDTGEIFEFHINARFFVEQNPRWIIPLLHDAIRQKGFDFPSLLSRQVLKVYWNGEVFNELVLLALNGQEPNPVFTQKVCSTFAKPRFFNEFNGLFEPFDPPHSSSGNSGNSIDKTRFAEPIYSFRELESKGRHIEWLPNTLPDMNAFFGRVLNAFQSPLFDFSAYPADIRYHAWLQILAIRASLAQPQYGLRIDPSFFPPDVAPRILQTWSARNMLPIAQKWPEIPFSDLLTDERHVENKARRLWWYLRTEQVTMTESSGLPPHARMFECVEQLTNKTAGKESGPILFSLHQYLLGLDMSNPIGDL